MPSFIYNGTTFQPLNNTFGGVTAYDIEGNKFVGGQYSAGFLYDGSKYTQPLGNGALPGLNNQSFTFTGISGNRLVGFYTDLPPVSLPHPFIYVIPEPTTLTLSILGACILCFAVWLRARKQRIAAQHCL